VTGNVCDRETYDYLRSVAPDIHAVRGDWDDATSRPPSLVTAHGALRIALIHGHQAVPVGDSEALSNLARRMDADVLISGGTHKFEAFEYDGRFFINPGSATGALLVGEPFSARAPEQASDEAAGDDPPAPTPSFALLDIQGTPTSAALDRRRS
jgi:vacuolar protein sorting-associated protein 29